MGNWNINIQGIGSHHNPDHAKDADRMAKEFVHRLAEAGHTIEVANFTAGSKTPLIVPQAEAKAGNPNDGGW